MKSLNTRMLVLLLAVIGLLSTNVAIAQDPAPEIIYYDYIDDDGVLKGGRLEVYPDSPLHSAFEDPNAPPLDSYPDWDVNTIIYNGDPNNRIDLVILGDGYDVNDINDGIYAAHVSSIINGFFAELPLDEYASFFNVHRVDVISEDSGVSHDPNYPDPRNTALDMGFWSMYMGKRMERLLTIGDTAAANAAANQAPGREIVMALANSTKYGGSGGTYTCLAGGNEWRVELGLHECGHSFAGLGDEYDYTYDPNDPNDGNSPYPWDESSLDGIGNLSTLYATDMNSSPGAKWYRWLDWGPEPKDVWTFEGADHYKIGIYQPTKWSKMRALHDDNNVPYPFYQVNMEQFVLKIYEIVNPIDDATPPGTYPVGTASIPFFVEPLQPATYSLDVQWYLDGNSIPGATGTTLDASTLNLSPGEHTLDVNVIDNTDLVRDEGERDRLMSDSRTWTLMKMALVGYWKLDETSDTIAADSSIYDNNGILNNMDPNTDWVAGKINGALDFDGEDDYVSLSPIAVLEDNTVTIAAWIKADDVNQGLHPIVTQYDGVNYFGYYFYVSGNRPTFYLAGDYAQSSVSINADEWYHLAGTYDGSDLKIYVDGEEKGSGSSNKTGCSHNAYIGYDGNGNYFDGVIDDVRIYNWALDANEVWELSYESDADFNGDDIVNFFDYAMFANAWQTDSNDPNYNDICDLADNNSIDYNDLALFTDDWLWQAGGAMTMAQSMGQGMSQNLRLTEGLYTSAPAEQQEPQVSEPDIEEIINWLEELWLTDEQVRKMISEDDWQKFVESVAENM